MKSLFLLAVVIAISALTETAAQRRLFISIKAQTFQLSNKPYYFIGTNYWYGSLLGLEKDKRRGINRLRKELDFLHKNGVTNLRLMAGAEGSGSLNGVMRVGPALQPKQGEFNERVLDGLDLILSEMSRRRMKAVIFLSNNWEWSGGFQQYLIWNGQASEDLLTRKPSWDELRDVVSKFYSCDPCKASYMKQVRFVMERTNTITKKKYVDDATIMAWELANEPRPMRPAARGAYMRWLREVAAAIKARDKNHLVTIGHEGSIGTESMEVFEEIHRDANIDYLTIHIWAKNWGWFSEGKLAADFSVVVQKATAYIDEHVIVARRLNKPLVIEEFGLPRDEVRREAKTRRPGDEAEEFPAKTQSRKEDFLTLHPDSPTSLRDEYFRKIFSYVGKGPVAGANFWAFGGTARPVKGQIFWKAGDEWMGDPPMEEQGLNTVFDNDVTTWRVIRSLVLSGKR